MTKTFFYLSFIFLLLSCEGKKTEGEFDRSLLKGGPSITGKVGDILVVCEDYVWKSDAKKNLDSTLTRFIMPYFPDVATFELVHRTPIQFTHGFRRYRNLMFLTIDKNYKGKKASIKYEKDLYAYNQMTVTVIANNMQQLEQACKYGMEEVHAVFDEIEWQRLIETYDDQNGQVTTEIVRKLKEKFKITISLPENSQIISEKDDFFSIAFPSAFRPTEYKKSGGKIEPGMIYSGVMFYTSPYIDSTDLTTECLLTIRDSTLKKYVPSDVAGMYMGTQYVKFVYPEGTADKNMDGSITGTEIRGMYMFKGLPKHSVGGAFWSFSFYHPKLKMVLNISGFVEAPPTTSWTHFIRELEAVWKSVKIA